MEGDNMEGQRDRGGDSEGGRVPVRPDRESESQGDAVQYPHGPGAGAVWLRVRLARTRSATASLRSSWLKFKLDAAALSRAAESLPPPVKFA